MYKDARCPTPSRHNRREVRKQGEGCGSQGSGNSKTAKKRKKDVIEQKQGRKARKGRHLDVPHASAKAGNTLTISALKLSHRKKWTGLRCVVTTARAATNSGGAPADGTKLSLVLLSLLEFLTTTCTLRSCPTLVSTSAVTS
jgi:hypothetical protein